MMRFTPPPEPPDWRNEAYIPGMTWLSSNIAAERPHDYWTGENRKFTRYLRDGQLGLCAYTAITLANGTVDHFIPWASVRGQGFAREMLAYTWPNLRYAVGWFNSARGSAPIPDPFDVQDDWFKVLLPSCELVATDRVPPEHQANVSHALRWLGRDDRAIDARKPWFDDYLSGGITLQTIERRAPLIARALRAPENRRFLRVADRPAPDSAP